MAPRKYTSLDGVALLGLQNESSGMSDVFRDADEMVHQVLNDISTSEDRVYEINTFLNSQFWSSPFHQDGLPKRLLVLQALLKYVNAANIGAANLDAVLQAIVGKQYHYEENLKTITSNITSPQKTIAICTAIIDSPAVGREGIDDVLEHLDAIDDFPTRLALLEKITTLTDKRLVRQKRDAAAYEKHSRLFALSKNARSLNQIIEFAKASDANRKLVEENCDAIIRTNFSSIPAATHSAHLRKFIEAPIPVYDESVELVLMFLKRIVKHIQRENLTDDLLFKRLKDIINYPLTDTELFESSVDAYLERKSNHPDTAAEQLDFMAMASLSPRASKEYKTRLSDHVIAELTKDNVDDPLTTENNTPKHLRADGSSLDRLMFYARDHIYIKQFAVTHIEAIVDGIFQNIPGERRLEYISTFIDSFDDSQESRRGRKELGSQLRWLPRSAGVGNMEQALKDSQESIRDLKELILRRLARSAGIGNIGQALVVPILRRLIGHAPHNSEMLHAIVDGISANNLHGSSAFALITEISQHKDADEATVDIVIHGLIALAMQGDRSDEQYEKEVLRSLPMVLRDVKKADKFAERYLTRILAIATDAPLPSEPVRMIMFEAIIRDPCHTAEHITSIFNFHLEEESVERRIALLRVIVRSPFATQQHKDTLSQQKAIRQLINQSQSFKDLTDFVKESDTNAVEAIKRIDAFFDGICSRSQHEYAIHLRRIIESELPTDRTDANVSQICELMLQKAAETIKTTDAGANELANTVIRHPLTNAGSLQLAIGKHAAWNSAIDTLIVLTEASGLQSLTESHRRELLDSIKFILAQLSPEETLDLFIAAAEHPSVSEHTINTAATYIHLVLRADVEKEVHRMLQKLHRLMTLMTNSGHCNADHLDILLNATKDATIAEDFNWVVVNAVINAPECTRAHADTIVGERVDTFTSAKRRLDLLIEVQKFRDDPEKLRQARRAELTERFTSLQAFIDFLISANSNPDGKAPILATEDIYIIFAGIFKKHNVAQAYDGNRRVNSAHDHSQLLMALCEKISSIPSNNVELKTQLFNCVVKHVTKWNVDTNTNSLAILTTIRNDSDVTTQTINVIASEGIRWLRKYPRSGPVVSFLRSLVKHDKADSETITSVIAYACGGEIRGAENALLELFASVINKQNHLTLGHLTALVQLINRTSLPTKEWRQKALNVVQKKYADKRQKQLIELKERESRLVRENEQREVRERALGPAEEGVQERSEETQPDQNALHSELRNVRSDLRWMREGKQSLSTMPYEILEAIMANIPLEHLYDFALVSKDFENLLFRSLRIAVLNNIPPPMPAEAQQALQILEDIYGDQQTENISVHKALGILSMLHPSQEQAEEYQKIIDARQTLKEAVLRPSVTVLEVNRAMEALATLENVQERESQHLNAFVQNLQVQPRLINWILRDMAPSQLLQSLTALRSLQIDGVLTRVHVLGVSRGIILGLQGDLVEDEDIQRAQLVRNTLRDRLNPRAPATQPPLTTSQTAHVRQALRWLDGLQCLLNMRQQGAIEELQVWRILRVQLSYLLLRAIQYFIPRQAQVAQIEKFVNAVLAHPACNDTALESVISTVSVLYKTNVMKWRQLVTFVDKVIRHKEANAGIVALASPDAIASSAEQQQALRTLQNIKVLGGRHNQNLTAQIALEPLENIHRERHPYIPIDEYERISQAYQTLQAMPSGRPLTFHQDLQAHEAAIQTLQRHLANQVSSAHSLLERSLLRQNPEPEEAKHAERILQALESRQLLETLTALYELQAVEVLTRAQVLEVVGILLNPALVTSEEASRARIVEDTLRNTLRSELSLSQKPLTVKQAKLAAQAIRGLKTLRSLLALQNQDVLSANEAWYILRALQYYPLFQALQCGIARQTPQIWLVRSLGSTLDNPRSNAAELNSVLVRAGDLYLTRAITVDQLNSLVDIAVNHDNANSSVLNWVITALKARQDDPCIAPLLTTVMNSKKADLPGGPIASSIIQDIIDGTLNVANDQLVLVLSNAISSTYAQINTLDKLIDGLESGALLVSRDELGPLLTTVVGRPYISTELLNKTILGVIEKRLSVADEYVTDVLLQGIQSAPANSSTLRIIVDSIKNKTLSIPQNRLGELLSATVNSDPGTTALLNEIVESVIRQDIALAEADVADFLIQAMDSRHADHTTAATLVRSIKENPAAIPRNRLGEVVLAAINKGTADATLLNDVIDSVLQQRIPLGEADVADFLIQAMDSRHADHTTAATLVRSIKENPSAIPQNRMGEVVLAATNKGPADATLLNDVIGSVLQQRIPLGEEYVVGFLLQAMDYSHADPTTAATLVRGIKENPSTIPQNRMGEVVLAAINKGPADATLLNDVIDSVLQERIPLAEADVAGFSIQAMDSHADHTTLKNIVECLNNNSTIVSPPHLEQLLLAALQHHSANTDLLNSIVDGVIQKTLPIPSNSVGTFLFDAIKGGYSRHADNSTLDIVLRGIKTDGLLDPSTKAALLITACSVPYADKSTLSASIPLLFNPAIGISQLRLFNTLLETLDNERTDADIMNLALAGIYNTPHLISAADCLGIFSRMLQSDRHDSATINWIGKIISERKITFQSLQPDQITELMKLPNDILQSHHRGSEVMGHVIKTMFDYRHLGQEFVGELFSKIVDADHSEHVDQSHVPQLLDSIPHCLPSDRLAHYINVMNLECFEESHARQIIRDNGENAENLNQAETTQLFTQLLDRSHGSSNVLINDLAVLDTIPALYVAARSLKATQETFATILDQLEDKVRLGESLTEIPGVLHAITRHENVPTDEFSRAFNLRNDIPGASKSALLDEASQYPNIAKHLDSFFEQLGIAGSKKAKWVFGREIAMDDSPEKESYIDYYERVARRPEISERHLGTLLQLASKKNMPDPHHRFRLRIAVGLNANASITQIEEVAKKVEEYIKDNAESMVDKDQALDQLMAIKTKGLHKRIFLDRPMKIVDISTEDRTFQTVPVGFSVVGNGKKHSERASLLYAVQRENPSDSEPTHFYATCRPLQIKNAEDALLNFTWGKVQGNAGTFSKGRDGPAVQALIAPLEGASGNVQIRFSPYNASQLEPPTLSHGLSALTHH